MSANGGGKAVNAGVDFQSRLSALFMVHAIIDLPVENVFGFGGAQTIQEFGFETAHAVDDIRLSLDSSVVYIQAKRTINFSDSDDSEFVKTIRQFLSQALAENRPDSFFVLATSTASSRKITRELKCLLESIRNNGGKWGERVLNASESDTKTKIEKIINKTIFDFGAHQKLDPMDLLHRIHVVVFDIEENGSTERSILMLLSGKYSISPQILWSSLIGMSMALAANRDTLTTKALHERLHLLINNKTDNANETNIGISMKQTGPLPAMMDFVLVDYLPENGKTGLIELFRFEDDGRKRIRYNKETIHLKNGASYKVILRAASYDGIVRFLDKNKEILSDRELVIVPANREGSQPGAGFSRAHSAKLADNMKNVIWHCVFCGDPIAEACEIVEVDQDDLQWRVGPVHEYCHQPCFRIIGRQSSDLFSSHPELKTFDFPKWYELLITGGCYGALVGGLPPGIRPTFWNPGEWNRANGMWCVAIHMVDGSREYAKQRGKVVRFSRSEAEEWASKMTEQYAKYSSNGDPFCISESKNVMAQRSQLVSIYGVDARPIACISATAERHHIEISRVYSDFNNYYAPMMYLADRDGGRPYVTGNAIFIITNPLKLGSYLENWSAAGYEFINFKIVILENDLQFDNLVTDAKQEGFQVVVNPLLRPDGSAISGELILNEDEITQLSSQQGEGQNDK